MQDLERVYDMLAEQNRVMMDQGKTLAGISQSLSDTHERLFGAGGQPGVVRFLQGEIDETSAVVAKHTHQLSLWRGGIAVLAFLWTGAAAVIAAIIKHR